jgi:hypothetical protein
MSAFGGHSGTGNWRTFQTNAVRDALSWRPKTDPFAGLSRLGQGGLVIEAGWLVKHVQWISRSVLPKG